LKQRKKEKKGHLKMDERLKRGSSTSEAEEPKTQQAENQRDKG